MFFHKSEPSKPSSAKSEQPTVEQLAKLGITVRDFAYESTLPPIAPVYFLPKQIQPDPRVTKAEPSLLSLSRQPSVDGNAVPTGGQVGVTRQRGFSDLREYSPGYHIDIPDNHSQPYSDEYVKTPVVTPNGSLQWQESEIPSDHTPIRPLSRGSSTEQVILSPSPSPTTKRKNRNSKEETTGVGTTTRYYLRKRPSRKTTKSGKSYVVK